MNDWAEKNERVTLRVEEAFPGAIEETIEFRGERTLIVDIKKLKAVCEFLRDDPELQYNFLEDVVADDMLPDFPRFAVNYHIYSIPKNHRVRLRTSSGGPGSRARRRSLTCGPLPPGWKWKYGI